ncbi:hypothetical protein QBC40DRAFT_263594 [Triangularia verruculosa]|uniref:Uncharacterized protein n=1 Tax=Triangularia verruculosa TaxID=2587418 RepID=A0AAN6XQP5_9PEZI|nr:hypothetical protein QBC40DRAFT_263594 [Triangularia verruculosa]
MAVVTLGTGEQDMTQLVNDNGNTLAAADCPSSGSVFSFRKAWGNFISGGNPSIANSIANGVASASPTAYRPISNWPVWNQNAPQFVNFNTTGGTLVEGPQTMWGTTPLQYEGPGIKNAISVHDANIWEAYRGDRCAFYKKLGRFIPN